MDSQATVRGSKLGSSRNLPSRRIGALELRALGGDGPERVYRTTTQHVVTADGPTSTFTEASALPESSRYVTT
jgi:hypothetical protein